jgi:integrase
MVWRFSPEESKTKKLRTVYVAPEIAEIVREQMRKYPEGVLFRTMRGKPWNPQILSSGFSKIRDKLNAEGRHIDGDLYTCRHTFAKRTLGGHWSGKPCSLEQLAGLMGNSPTICWKYYAKWADSYVDPLWDAVNGPATPTSPATQAQLAIYPPSASSSTG